MATKKEDKARETAVKAAKPAAKKAAAAKPAADMPAKAVKAAAAAPAAPAASVATGKTVKVKQIGSVIRCPQIQRLHLKALGLRKMHQVRELQDNPGVRGLIRKLPHLVQVVEG